MTERRDDPRLTSTAGHSLVLALYAFAVFGWELVATMLLDPLWASVGAAAGALLHWAVTAAGWLIGALLVFRAARRAAGASAAELAPLRGHTALRALGVLVAGAVAIGVRVVVLQEWKLVGEYERLSAAQGEATPLAFALLLVYYLCEACVILLVIALGQRAGEIAFGRPALPWGGLVLALTWGAVHIFLQGPATGVYAMAAAVLYGCIYAWGNRRTAPTYLLVTAAFLV
ncbi:hypothetical protein M4D51_10025 [Microbacterium sp. p3-SID338]|uniref:hypothetical protein n=1 Tax=unclassified Microbacterium TaxID=2609290 RepID=UPI000C7FF9CB|nr:MULTISPECIES: hypothetical protein [unclassified Microbacterium]MCT1396062.1 hypothetical protein [Microbacterium sp. p3-SID338]PMC06457.1 hypothetical protein CJ226_00480 [Microbacterium sp. UMB0228]